jgi:hypothetical protein
MIVLQHKHKDKDKHQGGVILVIQGLEELEAAKKNAEFLQNSGSPYTLEQISDRTRLAVNTVMKIYAREAGVDRYTLKRCFSICQAIIDNFTRSLFSRVETYYKDGLANIFTIPLYQPLQNGRAGTAPTDLETGFLARSPNPTISISANPTISI